MVLKIWGFNDKSEKIEIYFSVSQRAYLDTKWFFNPCKSIPIGDLAQILCLRRKHSCGRFYSLANLLHFPAKMRTSFIM